MEPPVNIRQLLFGTLFSCTALSWAASPAFAGGDDFRVYEYVIEKAHRSYKDLSNAIPEKARIDGWEVLAVREAGTPEGCTFHSTVITLVEPGFAAQLMQLNPATAPYAVVDRINVFEDENGTHISIVNPRSIYRTVFLDSPECLPPAALHRDRLRTLVLDAIGEASSVRPYGQKRSKGHIGRTMGVMAGGSFDSKLKDLVVIDGGDWQNVVQKVEQLFAAPESEWGLHAIYRYDLPKYQVTVFGFTGDRIESKSASIVKAGADKTRKKLAFPGLAHNGAYPFEVVVRSDGRNVHVQAVEAMFRMKMYFEDAGKMAFMKNMGMPGSIYDSLAKPLRAAFPAEPNHDQ
jgi:hypothetical protein